MLRKISQEERLDSASIRMKSVIRIRHKKNPDCIRFNPGFYPVWIIRMKTEIRVKIIYIFLLNYDIFVILHIARDLKPLALQL